MNSKNGSVAAEEAKRRESIAYIRQMLGELRLVALSEGAEMLSYLIEMAYVEAGDVQSGRRPLSISQHDRDKTARMSL